MRIDEQRAVFLCAFRGFFQDKPRDFVRRLKAYWKAWRAEIKQEAGDLAGGGVKGRYADKWWFVRRRVRGCEVEFLCLSGRWGHVFLEKSNWLPVARPIQAFKCLMFDVVLQT